MQHSFNDQEAADYGDREAIVIWNLRFWIIKNKANNKHQYPGEDGVMRTWTYNTQDAFQKLFWYWTKERTRRVLESLFEQEVIIKGNFNKSTWDKTCWYAFKDEAKFLSSERLFAHMANLPDRNGENDKSKRQNQQIDMADTENGEGENAESNTDIKPKTKTQMLNQIPGEGFLKVYEGWGFEEKRIYDSISKTTLKEVELIAPEKDIAWLIPHYAYFIREKQKGKWPKNINSAFPAWVKSFLKKEENKTPSSALTSTLKPKKFGAEKASPELMILRIKAILSPENWEKYFAGKPLEETEKGWKIIVDDAEAFQHEEILEAIKVKIELK